MFHRLVEQLCKGTPLVSSLDAPSSSDHRSIPVKMRHVVSEKVLFFRNISLAASHFHITDLRVIRGLLDNPERAWRGYQAKLQSDDTPWPEVTNNVQTRTTQTSKGVRKTYYLVTIKKTGRSHLCAGYAQAQAVTGLSQSYLSKIVCYGGQPKKLNFTIRVATEEDIKNHSPKKRKNV